MAVAAQAALLDELMGKGRNVAIGCVSLPHWSDEAICKHFLAGLCPHDLFTNTKDDLGACGKIHDNTMLENYCRSTRRGTMKYESQLCLYLEDLISTVESRIRRGQNRLKRNGSLVHSNYNSEREDKLDELEDTINETLARVEQLGTDGKVQESQVLLERAEDLKSEKVRLEKEIEIYNLQAKELEVCLICGAFQVKGDAQQRIEEHLQGKMHIGYAQIRQYLSDFSANNSGEARKNKEKELKENNTRSDSRKRQEKRSKKSDSHNDDRKYDKDKTNKRKRSKSKEKYFSDKKYGKKELENRKSSINKHSKREKESKSAKRHRRK